MASVFMWFPFRPTPRQALVPAKKEEALVVTLVRYPLIVKIPSAVMTGGTLGPATARFFSSLHGN